VACASAEDGPSATETATMADAAHTDLKTLMTASRTWITARVLTGEEARGLPDPF
jgi:hypothetical protein